MKKVKRSSEFFRDEMTNFLGSLGQRSAEGNLSVEMRSHEFFLKHAPEIGGKMHHCFWGIDAPGCGESKFK